MTQSARAHERSGLIRAGGSGPRLRFGRGAATALLLLACGAASEALAQYRPEAEAHAGQDLSLDATLVFDNNVTRSRSERLSDRSVGVSAGKSWLFPLSAHTRLSVVGSAGTERFGQHDGLSRLFAGLQGEFQYRPSGAFDAPTIGIFGRAFADAYESNLRDGYRYVLGARVLQPLTTDLDLFAAFAHNVRDGKSRVFDTRDYSLRLSLDYAVGGRNTLYAAGEYRRGDIVSSARPALDYVDIAEAIVTDDAFPGSGRQAYRVRANTLIGTVGYNLGLGEQHSLDFWLTRVRSTSRSRPTYPGADEVTYKDTQAGVAYLIRF